MNILDKIRTADPKTRVSFLHPDRAAESICDIQELREAVIPPNAFFVMEGLRGVMEHHPDYKQTWHDNLACAATDEGVPPEVANHIATRFLDRAFKSDVRS